LSERVIRGWDLLETSIVPEVVIEREHTVYVG